MPDAVEAPLNYLAEAIDGLATYAYDPPGGGPRFNGRLRSHAMAICNARTLDQAPRFATHGFECLHRPSAAGDLWDDTRVRQTYYAEAAEWIADLLQASRVIVFDHTCRRRADGRPPLDGSGGSFGSVRAPVGRVHADFTPRSAPARIAALLDQPADAPLPPYRIVGLWRPITHAPLQDAPLALAAIDSVRREDLVPNAIVYPERRGETYAVLHSERHRWHYYPAMVQDEALLFLHYDSHAAGAGTVPHTAFEDPATPAEAAPRQSIELRALVL